MDHAAETKSQNPERAFLHQISSPLTAIHFGLSQVMEDIGALAVLDPTIPQRLQMVLKSAERMSGMIAARRQELIDAAAAANKS